MTEDQDLLAMSAQVKAFEEVLDLFGRQGIDQDGYGEECDVAASRVVIAVRDRLRRLRFELRRRKRASQGAAA